jgi:hypothetical protein
MENPLKIIFSSPRIDREKRTKNNNFLSHPIQCFELPNYAYIKALSLIMRKLKTICVSLFCCFSLV